jgi:hypothetical protein
VGLGLGYCHCETRGHCVIWVVSVLALVIRTGYNSLLWWRLPPADTMEWKPYDYARTTSEFYAALVERLKGNPVIDRFEYCFLFGDTGEHERIKEAINSGCRKGEESTGRLSQSRRGICVHVCAAGWVNGVNRGGDAAFVLVVGVTASSPPLNDPRIAPFVQKLRKQCKNR